MIEAPARARLANRPLWPRPGRRNRRADDTDGPILLSNLARTIDERVSLVTRLRVTVEYSLIERDEYRPSAGDRAFFSASHGREVWCVVDAPSQRALLELVLGGPAARAFTSVEKSIAAESVRRLLETPDARSRCALKEAGDERPSGSQWRSNADLVGPSGRATLQLFVSVEQPPAPEPAALRIDVGSVPLSVSAWLVPTRVRLADVLAWRESSLFFIETARGGIDLQLRVGSLFVAAGRLGVSNGRRAALVADAAPARAA